MSQVQFDCSSWMWHWVWGAESSKAFFYYYNQRRGGGEVRWFLRVQGKKFCEVFFGVKWSLWRKFVVLKVQESIRFLLLFQIFSNFLSLNFLSLNLIFSSGREKVFLRNYLKIINKKVQKYYKIEFLSRKIILCIK